jgi:uncharacterized protein (TIGR03083 family)
VHQNLEFPEILRSLDERSSHLVAVVDAAPDLDAPVPSCPGWTLFDLVQHLGQGRRRWATIVTAGPDAEPPPSASSGRAPAAPRDRAQLTAWLAEGIHELSDARRTVGPDAACWTWWGDSQSPETSGSVARHQLQEVIVHTYDAQLAQGDPQPLPAELALDGVDEFQTTCCSTDVAWPHEDAVVDYHATEGRSWRLWLSAEGARSEPLDPSVGRPGSMGAKGSTQTYVSARASASDLVLCFYNRVPLEALEIDGDRRVLDQLVAWDPSV